MTHSPLLFNQSTQYSTLKLLNFMVLVEGFEPSIPYGQIILSHFCIPVPTHKQNFTNSAIRGQTFGRQVEIRTRNKGV